MGKLSGPRLASLLKMLFRFGVAGGVGFAINVFGVWFLENVGDWSPRNAFGVTLTVSYVANFWLARRFVFRSQQGVGRQVVRYLFISLCFRAFEYAIFSAVVDTLAVSGSLTAFLTLSVSMLAKFATYRLFVFRSLPHRKGAS